VYLPGDLLLTINHIIIIIIITIIITITKVEANVPMQAISAMAFTLARMRAPQHSTHTRHTIASVA
jgi:hypothetical protein